MYFAERADGAFQQTAAIKVLRRGAVAEATRFQAERAILARLEHPGISRLLDGGMHVDARPYMVMEYVEGMSLTEFCDSRRLDLRARLKLFIQVCDVVAYAHRSLVVHRDLKPRNILVTPDARVKLLDFGVAKLLDDVAGAAAEKLGPLTPDYAAPEQLTGQPITTAADVYALGVVLFEPLTCRKPFKIGISRRDSQARKVKKSGGRLRPDLPRGRKAWRWDIEATSLMKTSTKLEQARRFADWMARLEANQISDGAGGPWWSTPAWSLRSSRAFPTTTRSCSRRTT